MNVASAVFAISLFGNVLLAVYVVALQLELRSERRKHLALAENKGIEKKLVMPRKF